MLSSKKKHNSKSCYYYLHMVVNAIEVNYLALWYIYALESLISYNYVYDQFGITKGDP